MFTDKKSIIIISVALFVVLALIWYFLFNPGNDSVSPPPGGISPQDQQDILDKLKKPVIPPPSPPTGSKVNNPNNNTTLSDQEYQKLIDAMSAK